MAHSVGVRYAFMAAFAMGIVSLITQQLMIKEGEKKKHTSDAPVINPFKSFGLVTPDLRNLLISDILIRFCEQIPYAFVVIWAVTNNGITHPAIWSC